MFTCNNRKYNETIPSFLVLLTQYTFLVGTCGAARRAFVGNLYKKVKDKSMVAVLSGHKSDRKDFDRYWTPDDDIRQSMLDLLECRYN